MASTLPIEHEAKLLTLDVSAFIDSLDSKSIRYVKAYAFRRYIFDTIPAQTGTWLRLRTDGQQATLTAKKITDTSIGGTQEWEVEVSHFDDSLKILEQAGLLPKGYQENHRFDFRLGEATLSLDFWPLLEPYLEIEAKTTEAVLKATRLLGYAQTDMVTKNTMALYADIGVVLDTTPRLVLSDEQIQTIDDLTERLTNVAEHQGDH